MEASNIRQILAKCDQTPEASVKAFANHAKKKNRRKGLGIFF
jgi:hypothetical protein